MNKNLLTHSLTVLSAVLLCAGCASQRTLVLNESVGPKPESRATHPDQGELAVYSAFDTSMNVEDPRTPRHSDYNLLSTDGKVLQHVSNHTITFSDEPATVALKPGTYRIEARAARRGNVVVTAVIKANRVTAIYLDDSQPRTNDTAQSSFVFLPSGEIVGWKATP
jgi:hypothetical protein